MLRMLIVIEALTWGASFFLADPPTVVEVPKPAPAKWVEFKVSTGEQLQLKTEKAAKWVLLGDGAQLRTPLDVAEATCATFTAAKPGRYLGSSTSADGTTLFAVTVSGPAPGPDIPPTPPNPVDPLKAKLKTAFDADPETVLAKKQGFAKDLAVLYTASAGIAKDPAVVLASDLVEKVRNAAKNLLKDPPDPAPKILAGVRQVVAAEIAAILPTDGPLTEAQRDSAANLFTRLASILEGF